MQREEKGYEKGKVASKAEFVDRLDTSFAPKINQIKYFCYTYILLYSHTKHSQSN